MRVCGILLNESWPIPIRSVSQVYYYFDLVVVAIYTTNLAQLKIHGSKDFIYGKLIFIEAAGPVEDVYFVCIVRVFDKNTNSLACTSTPQSVERRLMKSL